MVSRIYKSLLYKNHFLGIPFEWFIGSGIVTIILIYPWSIIGSIIFLFFLLLIGRFIALYYDHDFAKILALKIRTTSFNSDKYFHCQESTKKSFSNITEPISLLLKKSKFKIILTVINKIKKIFPITKINWDIIYNVKFLEYLPITHIKDAFLHHKNGNISIFLELKGINKQTFNISEEAIFESKIAFINGISSQFKITYYSIREAKKITKKTTKFFNATAQKINDKWEESFYYELYNTYYLKITKKKDIVSKLISEENIKKDILNTAERISKTLTNYSPRVIKENDELAKIITELIGSYPCKIKGNKITTETLFNNPFKIKNFAIDATGKYSTFLNIKQFHTDQIYDDLFTQITQLNFKTIFYLHFDSQPPQIIKEKMNFKKKQNAAKSDTDEVNEEMREIIEGIEAGSLKVAKVNMGIQIFADNKTELVKNINLINEIFQSHSIQVQNEMGVFLAYFYSIFEPILHPRTIYLTTKNIATMISPVKIEKGEKKTPWGNEAISKFYNTANGIYHLTLHSSMEDEGDLPPGHTLAIGTTGSGKTSFINFLLSQMLKYEDMRIFSIDSMRGQFIFTETHEGNYRDLTEKGINLNPLALENNEENKTFLAIFFNIMLDATIEEQKMIENTIFDIIGNENSNLQEFSKLLIKKGSILKDKITQWTTGAYSGHFNGKENIKLNNIECFNLSAIKNNKKLVALYSLYFYHQFMIQNTGKKGVIFFDELKSYLDTSLGDLFLNLTAQARKDNKIIIGALQSINQINNHIGKNIIDNISTFILYPIGEKISESNKELYRDLIGLNDKEINFLSSYQHSSRLVLIKKSNHSVIISIDLLHLQEYLKIFNSNQEKTLKLKTALKIL